MASTMTKFARLKIPLEDVVKATNNFNYDNIIKHGGFSKTYQGQLLRSGKLMKIAARRFDCNHEEGNLKFLTEISVLSDLKHTNLVSIIGFCDEDEEKIIVTTYEANGSLEQHLDNPNLTWMQRLRICVCVAQALSYLRYDKGRDYCIIHCNINSDTILLDENWEAKLSGFEISIKQALYHKDQVCLIEHVDTMGYGDPAIEKTGGVTHKSDIYSFGVVLLEILCGRKAFSNEANRFLAPLAKYHYENGTLQDIIHPDRWHQMSMKSLFKYSKVAYSCLKEERAHRPNTDNIVDTLEKALESHLRHKTNGNKLEHLKIRLSDIKLATENFSKPNRFVANGWYTLYRAGLSHVDIENSSSIEGKIGGELPKRHNTVIIKRLLPRDDEEGEELFFTEIEILTRVRHPNIVTLLGICVEGSELILVTDNVSNGYLAHYLRNIYERRILTWEKRLKICIDVAQALNDLHYKMKVINCNISSFNIGLDENWGAKIVHFNYSVFLPPNQEDEAFYPNRIAGNNYCIDPEYEKSGKLNRESDVYSFGVVLFEMLCGRTSYDVIYKKESGKGLAPVARQNYRMGTLDDVIDPIIKEETGENSFVLIRGPNKDSLHAFIEIAYQCVEETQDRRPTMKVVVKELEKALFFQSMASKIAKWSPLRISLDAIVKATNNFHEDNITGMVNIVPHTKD